MEDVYLPLTPRQLQFCYEYITDLNGTQAAIRAGYSKDSAGCRATELLKLPLVQQEIERLKDERIKRVLITADYVLVSLKEVAERCMQRVPAMYYDKVEKCKKQVTTMVAEQDGTLHEVGVWEFDSAGAVRALELLGKHLKLLPDGGINVKVAAIASAGSSMKNKSDEELDVIVARARR